MLLTLEPGRDILFQHKSALTELGSSDPERDILYNDVTELDGPVGYRIWYNTGTSDDKAAVVSQFFKNGASTHTVFPRCVSFVLP